MRENRTYGSEGGEAKAFPTPIRLGQDCGGCLWIPAFAGMTTVLQAHRNDLLNLNDSTH